MISQAHDTFDQIVDRHCKEIADMLKSKNASYGDSVANPTKIFSKLPPMERLGVRIDDKLSRLAKGTEYPGDDTIDDLIGYLILWKVTKERVKNG